MKPPAVVIAVVAAAPAVARSGEFAVDLLRKRLRAERGAARRCCRGGGRGRLSGYLQGCMLFDKPTKSRGSCVTRSAKNKTGFFLPVPLGAHAGLYRLIVNLRAAIRRCPSRNVAETPRAKLRPAKLRPDINRPCSHVLISGRFDGGDKTLKVWDVATGKCLATMEGHSSSVRCGVRCTFVMMCLRRRSAALPCFRTGGASCLGRATTPCLRRATTRSRCGTSRLANAWRR